jgi:hypothetical protein
MMVSPRDTPSNPPVGAKPSHFSSGNTGAGGQRPGRDSIWWSGSRRGRDASAQAEARQQLLAYGRKVGNVGRVCARK